MISNLLRTTSKTKFDRVFYKFKENNFEKLDRLIELHKYYTEKVKNTPEYDENDPEAEDDGYFTLQVVDFLIIFLNNLSDFDINDHLSQMISMNGIDKMDIQRVYQSYARSFGIEDKDELPLDSEAKSKHISVSQNPSESESEELSAGSKRIKVNEYTLNTDNLQR